MNDLRVAYHEAGHAVVGHLKGLVVESLTVGAPGSQGRVDMQYVPIEDLHDLRGARFDSAELDALVGKVLAQVTNYFAGWLAESKFLGQPARMAGSITDMVNAHDVMEALQGITPLGNFTDALTALEDEAAALLNEPTVWAIVQRVALALEERGTLDASQFQALVTA